MDRQNGCPFKYFIGLLPSFKPWEIRNSSGFKQWCSDSTEIISGSENVTVAELRRIKTHTPVDCMKFALPEVVTVHSSASLV